MGVAVPTSLAAWTAALQALLPPGRAFTREPASVLAKLLDACAAMLKGGQDKLDALALESDPRQALTMLPEWESLLGLPDACYTPLKQLLVPGVYDPAALSVLSFTRASVATLFDSTGAPKTAAVNESRLNYDPFNLLMHNLLIEAAGVNYLPYASTPAVWGQFTEGTSAGTVTTVVDPQFGTVVRLTKTAGAAGDRFGISVAMAGLSGNNFAITVLAKSNVAGTTSTPAYMDAARVSGGLVSANFPLTAAVGVWRKYEATAAGPLAGNGQFYSLIGGPIGSSIDFVMPQLELAAVASSFIPNSTAGTGVRAADVCYINVPRSTVERRALAFQRLTEQGGQSRQYFIDMAAALGEPGCTLTEFRPMNCNDDCNDALISAADKFSWRVTVPHSNTGARPMNCNDDCNDPLDLGGESVITCPIRERAPAHTNVYFAYASA